MADVTQAAEPELDPGGFEPGGFEPSPGAPGPEPEPEEEAEHPGSPYKAELRAQLEAGGALRKREPEAPLPAGETLRETIKQTVEQSDPLAAAAAPFAEVMRQAGVDHIALASRALHTIAAMDADPGRGVHDLFELAIARDPAAGPKLLVRALDAAGLELTPDGRIQAMSENSRAVVNARRELEQFTSAKDARGQPRYPQFEAVRPQMAALLQQAIARGQRLSLEQLYRLATQSAPAVSPSAARRVAGGRAA